MCPVTAASPPTLMGVTALRCCATPVPDAFTSRALEEVDGFALAGIEQLSGKPKRGRTATTTRTELNPDDVARASTLERETGRRTPDGKFGDMIGWNGLLDRSDGLPVRDRIGYPKRFPSIRSGNFNDRKRKASHSQGHIPAKRPLDYPPSGISG
jgi:hypothetical protein